MKTRMFFSVGLGLLFAVLVTAMPAQAALPAGLSWIKAGTNPVVTNSLCYSGDHFDPALVVESPSNYKMYFSSRVSGSEIYLATTTDGGLNWTCSGGPVLTRGSSGAWDADRVMTPTVIKDGSDYKMWYTGRDVADPAVAVYALGYATSSDGLSFTKVGSVPVLKKGDPSAWDSQYVREPSVIKVSGTYHMWYSGTAKWPFFRIGHASSPDGINWTKDSGNPVLTPTAGSWDANEVYAPSVVKNGSDYEMFYSGNAGGRWITGHATAGSPGGTWTKDANAIISPDSTGWEAGFDSADYVGALLDGTTWKIFYSSGGTYQIGLATLSNQAQLTFNQLATSLTMGAGTQVVKIDVNDVTNLYGYQFEVNYNPAKVSASAVFVNTFFNTSGTLIPDDWDASCDAGVCKFASSKVGAAAASSGSGTLAQITFTPVAPGDSSLTFTNNILSQEGAVQITHATTTGFLTVFGSATVTGIVQMQGRTTPGDAGTVTIYDQFGYAPPTTVAFSPTDGTFSATVAVYPDSTAFDVEASHVLYLTNRLTGITLSNGSTYNIPTTTNLKGGDADNSGKVGVEDVTCIGARFGLTGTQCGDTVTGNSDITNNGIVNIFDLVLAGGNYDLASPQPW